MRARIIKLLRLARDQADQPEGKTAARLAEKLGKKFKIAIDEDELAEKSVPQVNRLWSVSTGESRCYWIEFLLVGLCSTLYGGTVIPFEGPPWVIVITGKHDEVKIKDLQAHFEFWEQIIREKEKIKRDLESAFSSDEEDIEFKVQSFLYGLVFQLIESLHTTTLEAVAFTQEAEDLKQQTIEGTSLVHQENYEVQTVQPDWLHFDHGRRTAKSIPTYSPPVDAEIDG